MQLLLKSIHTGKHIHLFVLAYLYTKFCGNFMRYISQIKKKKFLLLINHLNIFFNKNIMLKVVDMIIVCDKELRLRMVSLSFILLDILCCFIYVYIKYISLSW